MGENEVVIKVLFDPQWMMADMCGLQVILVI